MTVMSMVVGEDLPRFLKGDPISCGYCKQPLDLGMVLPVLDSKAAAAYQSALCTIAALEAEIITEKRLLATHVAASYTDIHAPILDQIEKLILPRCPDCKVVLPDFDGCCCSPWQQV